MRRSGAGADLRLEKRFVVTPSGVEVWLEKRLRSHSRFLLLLPTSHA
jgi:hypothetical protein